MSDLTRSARPRQFVQFPRAIAGLALVAVVVGRSLAPALWGAGAGLDRLIAGMDAAGGQVTYLFALVGIAAMVQAAMQTFRDPKIAAAYRLASLFATMQVTLAVGLACYRPLPAFANIAVAAASGSLAILSALQTVRAPHTRALGFLLFTAGLAASIHLAAAILAWLAGEHALLGLAVFARVLATGAVLFDALTVFTVFAWLNTRSQKEGVWLARGALFVGCVVAWSVARGPGDGDSFFQVVADRLLSRQVTAPPPYVWEPLRYVLETCAPLLAAAVLVVRRQMPGVVAPMALLLLARPSTDVPLAAVGLTLAALFGALAARDDRALWAVLLDEEPSVHHTA